MHRRFHASRRGRVDAALLALVACCAIIGCVGTADNDAFAQTARVPSAGKERVRNGGFEEASAGGLPAGWVSRFSERGSISRVEDFSFSGGAAVKLAPNRSNDANRPLALAQEIDAAGYEGEEIVFSGRMATSGGARALIGLMSEVDGKQSPFTLIYQAPTNGKWAYQEKRFRVPAGPGVRLYLSIWVPDASGAVWFDDVSVRAAAPPAARTAGTQPSAGGGADSPRPAAAASRGAAGRAAPEEPQADALDASIAVDAGRTLRAIPPTLFGANIEWRWNATSLWQEREHRADPKIVSLARDLGVTLLRYPGGIYSDYYHWRDGVGPYERRPEVKHEPGKADQSRPNFGTDEVLKLADDIGAEVMITVNVTTGTAEEAADWVRYVNRDKRLRVRFWEIGNEQYIKTDSAVSRAATMTPEQYARKVEEFAVAMKAADPRIRIGIIGGLNEGSYSPIGYPGWNDTVLRSVGRYADFLSVHNAYAPILTGDERGKDLRAVYRSMLGRPQAIARNLQRLSAQLERYYPDPASRPFIAVTEWGPLFQFSLQGQYVDHPKTLGSALFVASTLEKFIESPSTDLAAFWMLNDFSALGWIGSANDRFPPDPDWAPTARYFAFQLFSKHFGRRLVESSAQSPTFATERIGWSDAEKNVPYLDVVASLSEDGTKLYVLAVNKHFDAPVRARIDLRGFVPAADGTAWVLNGTAIDANTGTKIIAVPGQKRVRQSEDARGGRFARGSRDEIWLESRAADGLGPGFTYTFEPHSVTSLELRRK